MTKRPPTKAPAWLRAGRARWVVLGGVVAVLAVVAAAVLVLRDPAEPDRGTPDGVAYATAEALRGKDISSLQDVLCDPAALQGDTSSGAAAALAQPEVTVVVHHREPARVTGGTATARLDLTVSYPGGSQDLTTTLHLTRRGTGWCLADLD